MGRIVGVIAIAAIAGMVGCIDVEGGERGTYSTPCTGPFSDLGLCGRETGGAPPAGDAPGEPDRPFTCADACELICSCGFCDSPDDQAQCTAACEADTPPQALLDCIEQQGCNFQVCFEG